MPHTNKTAFGVNAKDKTGKGWEKGYNYTATTFPPRV